tara:strand:- start:404 stop:817 length:414 start_codon:yes stop_codon:yes gene_type:complete
MAKKILKDTNKFAKFLSACKNITGEHPKLMTKGLEFDAAITEEIFNSSTLQWETGVASNGEAIMSDDCPHEELTWSAIQTEMDRLQAEWDAKEYQRLRKKKNEYPTVEELVVALYEPEDRADIDARRLATKQKFPKP